MSRDDNIDYGKLRQLVEAALDGGKFKSARALSLEASDGRNADLIRNFLEGTRPSLQSVIGLCKTLGIDLSALVKGAEPTKESATEWLTVSGAVEAGVWREQVEWGPDDCYQIEVVPTGDMGPHHGLVVSGRSMDRVFPPGTVLRCVDLISGTARDWDDGDCVIVERKQGGLRELTCKRLSRRPDGDWELLADSYLPEFQEPIFIGQPVETDNGVGFDGITDDEIRVRALVIDAIMPLRRRRTRPVPGTH